MADLLPLLYPTITSLSLVQVLGYLWYHPLLFGKRWTDAMKKSDPEFKPETNMMVVLETTVVWAISCAMYSWLRVMVMGAESNELKDLVLLSVAAWLGFSLPSGAFAVMYENRSREVVILSLQYLLVCFLLMAFVHWLL